MFFPSLWPQTQNSCFHKTQNSCENSFFLSAVAPCPCSPPCLLQLLVKQLRRKCRQDPAHGEWRTEVEAERKGPSVAPHCPQGPCKILVPLDMEGSSSSSSCFSVSPRGRASPDHGWVLPHPSHHLHCTSARWATQAL